MKKKANDNSNYLAIKFPIWEYKRRWGNRLVDFMVCLTAEDAKKFVEEFNSENIGSSASDWYKVASTSFSSIDLTQKQYKILQKRKRMYLREVN